MRLFFLIISICACSLSAQSDWAKWEAKQIPYEIPASHQQEYKIDSSDLGMTLISFAHNTYNFFVSDLDGDNCPFYPSCSSFFVLSVKETNIILGTLMFADRFTRDLNFFKGMNRYPIAANGKFIDPPSNYTMHIQKIKFD